MFLRVSSALLIFPFFLLAAPQDQEVFIDFEEADGSGKFTLGEPPNDILFIGFTIETLEDPILLHSGSKALTLGPDQEGRIVSNRGISTIEFYAAESPVETYCRRTAPRSSSQRVDRQPPDSRP